MQAHSIESCWRLFQNISSSAQWLCWVFLSMKKTYSKNRVAVNLYNMTEHLLTDVECLWPQVTFCSIGSTKHLLPEIRPMHVFNTLVNLQPFRNSLVATFYLTRGSIFFFDVLRQNLLCQLDYIFWFYYCVCHS